jgi:hypothetical protein
MPRRHNGRVVPAGKREGAPAAGETAVLPAPFSKSLGSGIPAGRVTTDGSLGRCNCRIALILNRRFLDLAAGVN